MSNDYANNKAMILKRDFQFSGSTASNLISGGKYLCIAIEAGRSSVFTG
jgi:hypothetical protein